MAVCPLELGTTRTADNVRCCRPGKHDDYSTVYAASVPMREKGGGEGRARILMTTQIVSCAIHPAIGIARVGNSQDGFFLGPEVPEVAPNPGTFKDSQGAVKRQAARFRLYGLDRQGQVVKELTAADGEITWFAHLANKKAAWYQFQLALDCPEARQWPQSLQQSSRRNATYTGGTRNQLVIDPGQREISGTNIEGGQYKFDSGSFLGNPVYLGELRTDENGRLIILGGRGHSGTPLPNNRATAFGNNDGWHDDVSDGPVRASIKLGEKTLWATPAWVVVAPPAFAPGIQAVVTLYDIAYQANLDAGRGNPHRSVSFTRDIYPILQRLTRLQWVNQGFLKEFGWGGENNLIGSTLSTLASTSSTAARERRAVFDHFRNPAVNRIEPDKWPPVYGDSFGQYPPMNPPMWPQQFLTVTREQFRCLSEWSAGNFQGDWNPGASQPASIGEVPLGHQPSTLDRAALSACSGGPFHPGAEATWPMRVRTMYADLCRLTHRQQSDPPEPDYGDVLTPDLALGSQGPLHRSGPGDITRWMAVPWQTDTSSCGSQYPNAGTVNDTNGHALIDLPTFWPAAVPNRILTHAAYLRVVNEGLPLNARQTAFQGRLAWSRHLPQTSFEDHINAFVTEWSQMGLVQEQPGPADGHFPGKIFVETENTFPTHPSVAASVAAGVEPDQAERDAFSAVPSMPLVPDWRSHQ